MTVRLNGREVTVGDGATVGEVLGLLDLAPDARGIAGAVDEEVVPRGQWAARALAPGSRVEVLTAIQGG